MDYYNYTTSTREPSLLAPVFQMLDGTIQRVSDHRNQLHYPAFEQLGPGVTQQAVEVWSLLICLFGSRLEEEDGFLTIHSRGLISKGAWS